MAATSINFEDVSKCFSFDKARPVQALRDFSLSIAPGELLALAGPSGSGKTTLLRLVAGLELPDAGRIHIDGKNVSGVTPKERGVGMVFQNHALYPHLTARENLAFGLEIQKLSRAEIARRIENSAEILHLEKLLDKRPDTLSGGERQRVALGRAIVGQPKILLLDEPLSNLDPQLRIELRDEIRKLRHEFGLTILLVTHDQSDALALGDRIAIIRGGKLEQVGTPEQIYRRPANRFAGSFFGEMNFLQGRFANGKVEIACDGNQVIGLELPLVKSTFAEGMQLLLGFRPEAIVALSESAGLFEGYSAPFRIGVLGNEFAGAGHRLRGKLGSQAIVFNIRHRPQNTYLDVKLDLVETLIFDATGGQLLYKTRQSKSGVSPERGSQRPSEKFT